MSISLFFFFVVIFSHTITTVNACCSIGTLNSVNYYCDICSSLYISSNVCYCDSGYTKPCYTSSTCGTCACSSINCTAAYAPLYGYAVSTSGCPLGQTSVMQVNMQMTDSTTVDVYSMIYSELLNYINKVSFVYLTYQASVTCLGNVYTAIGTNLGLVISCNNLIQDCDYVIQYKRTCIAATTTTTTNTNPSGITTAPSGTINCYNGNNAPFPLGPGQYCLSYNFRCTSGNLACSSSEQNSGTCKTEYTVGDLNLCNTMKNNPQMYQNAFCCSTDMCANPVNNGSSPPECGSTSSANRFEIISLLSISMFLIYFGFFQ